MCVAVLVPTPEEQAAADEIATHESLGAAIKRLAAKRPKMQVPGRLHRIPVVYDGPDRLQVEVGDVKKLRPPRRDLRLRVGDYRVFFLSQGPRAIEILAVKHRREAYR